MNIGFCIRIVRFSDTVNLNWVEEEFVYPRYRVTEIVNLVMTQLISQRDYRAVGSTCSVFPEFDIKTAKYSFQYHRVKYKNSILYVQVMVKDLNI